MMNDDIRQFWREYYAPQIAKRRKLKKKIRKQELWTRAVFMECFNAILPDNYKVFSADISCHYDVRIADPNGKNWHFECKQWENGYRKSDNSIVMKEEKVNFLTTSTIGNNYYICFSTGNTTAYIADITQVIGEFIYYQKVTQYEEDDENTKKKNYKMLRFPVCRQINIKQALDKIGYTPDDYFSKLETTN